MNAQLKSALAAFLAEVATRRYVDDATQRRAGELLALVEAPPAPPVRCPNCLGGGRFLTECCDGSGGCSCRGQVLDMGPCRVCGGGGHVEDESTCDREANRRLIGGLHFIGTGPRGMYETWPNRGGYRS